MSIGTAGDAHAAARNFAALRNCDRGPVSDDYVLIRDVMVAMGDGVRLASDISLPGAVVPITINLWMTGHQICWIFGVEWLEEALEKLDASRLDGVVRKMRCPFLITHGAEDEPVPLADAGALYSASGSPDKTPRVFTAEEGGAQHCQRDYASIAFAVMFDRLEDKL
jgi:hypothetical protein